MAADIELSDETLAELLDAVREYPVEFAGISDGWLAFRLVQREELQPDQVRQIGNQLAQALGNAKTPALVDIRKNFRGIRLG